MTRIERFRAWLRRLNARLVDVSPPTPRQQFLSAVLAALVGLVAGEFEKWHFATKVILMVGGLVPSAFAYAYEFFRPQLTARGHPGRVAVGKLIDTTLCFCAALAYVGYVSVLFLPRAD